MRDIKEIKVLRNRLGLTQKELAATAGVSQSMIAKVESGSIDPSYSAVKKIFFALDSAKEREEVKVGNIMQKRIVSMGPNDNLRSAIRKMKRYAISQLPVLRSGKVFGVVTEADLLDGILNGKGKIREIMKDAPPTVPKNTSVREVSGLLRRYSMILVSERGKIVGIVTKSDVIEYL